MFNVFRFFVISGYLMAALYSFEKNLLTSTIDFYYRRIKRILPIYLFMIILTLIILSQQRGLILADQYDSVAEDSRWAIAMATNFEDLIKKRDFYNSVCFFLKQGCDDVCRTGKKRINSVFFVYRLNQVNILSFLMVAAVVHVSLYK